ncbi:MAG: MFS transporter [Candidatus Limnocylindrales bacterium]
MTERTADAAGGLFSAGRRTLSIGLVLTVTLVAFESLAVSTAMPIVARELGGIELYGWVFSAFFLADLVGIVVLGGLIDRGGLVRPLIIGLSLFGAGLLVGGTAASMPILVGGRLLQGFGAGGIAPVAYVAIGRALPANLQPRMLAVLSTAWVVPGIVGPAISGLIAEHLSWRLVFLGLLPLVVLAAVLTIPAMGRVTAEPPDPAGRDRLASGRRLPWAILLAGGAGLLLIGLSDASLLPGLLMVGLGIGVAVAAYRRLTPPGTLLAQPGLPAAILMRGVLTFAFFSVDAYVPLLLIGWRGIDATQAGIVLTAATLTWTAGAWIQARYIGRLGPGPLVAGGLVLVLLGIAILSLALSPQVPVIVAGLAWSIAGLGMGLGYAPLTLAVLADAPTDGQGAATAALQLSDVLGTAVGTGVSGALIAVALRAGSPQSAGLAAAFGVALVVGLLGLALTRRLRIGLDSARVTLEAR